MASIQPHGGRLVSRFSNASLDGMHVVEVSSDLRSDIENIADGIFSPLEGFVGQDDFESIVKTGRLKNGLAWTVPIVLDLDEQAAQDARQAGEVALAVAGEKFAFLKIEEAYTFDRLASAKAVYGTDDPSHPGVSKMIGMKGHLLGGKIEVSKRIPLGDIRKYRKTPKETREEMAKRGWKTIVGFQTRNVPHVAHEMLQKAALNVYDGLYVNPLIGKKKKGDFKDEVILAAYETLFNNYYPKNRAIFATLHTEMRYAGPKEAIHHAIMRKNFGCTHFIVGRDHAGVGRFYHPFASQEIFKNYPDLEIQPVTFPAFYYCKKCLSYANERNCPHGPEVRDELSGTKMRRMVSSGELPAEHLMRPEVSRLVVSFKEPFVQ
ncbi:MAG TPA: sulfate adenylyltransferase [Nitrososphaera sp.]|nr:sulfate adenylyltransferase [Nitrososphaera sp.]